MGVILRVLLLANLMLAALAVTQSRPFGFMAWANNFLTGAAYTEPVLLFSLAILCPARILWRGQPYWVGVVVLLLLEWALAIGMRLLLPGDVATLGTGFSGWQLVHDCLVVSMVSAVVLYYFYLREKAFSPALSEARLQALQARIRPHFLFNSLTAVLSLIRSEPRQAERTLEDLADLFRVLLREERRAVRLEEEIDLCKRYLAIESLRLGERLQVEWNVDPAALGATIPPLILQPLAENAVHHGIEPNAGPGLIAISVVRRGREVAIEIVNPREEGNTRPLGRKGNQMALDNVRERLSLHYDVEARLEAGPVRNPQTGADEYRVSITLPAREAEAPRVERRE